MHIYNGVDIDIFTSMPSFEIRKQLGITARYMLLGVATAWSDRKGLSDYYKLRELLSDEYVIVLVGLTAAQISTLPKGIVGIQRTHTQKELSELYSTADVVLSLSQAETFGLTVAEGMACGTPAVVYNASALPELITPQTGIVVDKVGDVAGVANAIRTLCHNEKSSYSASCRKHIEEQFDKNKCFQKYITLYDEILTKSKF